MCSAPVFDVSNYTLKPNNLEKVLFSGVNTFSDYPLQVFLLSFCWFLSMSEQMSIDDDVLTLKI